MWTRVATLFVSLLFLPRAKHADPWLCNRRQLSNEKKASKYMMINVWKYFKKLKRTQQLKKCVGAQSQPLRAFSLESLLTLSSAIWQKQTITISVNNDITIFTLQRRGQQGATHNSLNCKISVLFWAKETSQTSFICAHVYVLEPLKHLMNAEALQNQFPLFFNHQVFTL